MLIAPLPLTFVVYKNVLSLRFPLKRLPPYLSSFHSPHDSQNLMQVIIRHYRVQLQAESLGYIVLPTLDVGAREQSAAERDVYLLERFGNVKG